MEDPDLTVCARFFARGVVPLPRALGVQVEVLDESPEGRWRAAVEDDRERRARGAALYRCSVPEPSEQSPANITPESSPWP